MSDAFGAPGLEPRWTRSSKEGIGTSYHTSCRLWFTLSHGIINEIYYPHIDQPNTRDLQFSSPTVKLSSMKSGAIWSTKLPTRKKARFFTG